MPTRMLLAVGLLILFISAACGQTKKVPVLPEYTTEQRWARAQDHIESLFAVAFGYAKTLNHTADDVTQYAVKLFAPGWGTPGSATPMQVFRSMRRNLLAWSDWKVELLDSTENRVQGRFNRPYASRLFEKDGSFYDMTLSDYEGFTRGFHRGICDFLHLKYEDKVEGDWITFTISKK